jgi:HEPN domain-containing protein
MPPQPDEVQAWLQKAANDLLSARISLGHDPPVLETACFHCQQTVEKVLKAFLVWKAVRFEKVHSLTYLLDLCEGQDPRYTSMAGKEPRAGRTVVHGHKMSEVAYDRC